MVLLSLALRAWNLATTPLVQSTKYLESDPVFLRDAVQVLLAHFNEKQAASIGLKQFCVWSIPQIQYRNPHVQINILKEMTPSPWVQFYLVDPVTQVEETVLVDCHGKTREQIHDHLKRILGKTEKMVRREASLEATNPANFGYECNRWCMCEVDGQVPCPGRELLPPMKRRKYFINPGLIKEEEAEYIESLETYEERLKREKRKGIVHDHFLLGQPSVYHEENVHRWKELRERLLERERLKRGETE